MASLPPPPRTVALTVAVTRRVLVRARAAREKGRFDLHDTLGELQCSRELRRSAGYTEQIL